MTTWGRGLNQYRDMVGAVIIRSNDPNFAKLDLDVFADSVHCLTVGGPRNVRIENNYRGFKVALNGIPHGDVAFWCWKYNELIEDERVLSARGKDGTGGWSRERATTEYTTDFDEAMAKAVELSKLPERKKVEYKPDEPLTKKIADACVYASAGYGVTDEADVRALSVRLDNREHVLPKGVQGYYLSVDNAADIKLGAGDTVFLNPWGRIDGAIQGDTAYQLTCS